MKAKLIAELERMYGNRSEYRAKYFSSDFGTAMEKESSEMVSFYFLRISAYIDCAYELDVIDFDEMKDLRGKYLN